MSNSAPSSNPSSLEELRELRSYFAAEAAKASQKLHDVDQLIAEAEKAQQAAAREAAVKAYLPGDDKAVLNGHDFVFLVNNTKDAGHGPESLLGASVAPAYNFRSTLASAGLSSTTVKTLFWGGKTVGNSMDLDSKFGAAAYSTSGTVSHKILPLAKHILNASVPDKKTERPVHYVIMSDGTLDDDVATTASILDAASRMNPNATFDFIVCNARGATAVERLVNTWNDLGGAKKANAVRVYTPTQLDEAVKGVIKARLGGAVPAAPAQANAAKKKPAQKKKGTTP